MEEIRKTLINSQPTKVPIKPNLSRPITVAISLDVTNAINYNETKYKHTKKNAITLNFIEPLQQFEAFLYLLELAMKLLFLQWF